METRLGRRGRRGAGHRRLRDPRPPAHRLRHHPGARGAEHDLGPRLPRRPAGPLDRGLEGQHHRRPGRPEDRRLPGVAQPADLQARPRRRDPGPRDPGQRRPLHPRRRDRPGRPRAALLPALARISEAEAKQLVIEGFLVGARRALRGGPGPRGAGRRARAPARADPRLRRAPWRRRRAEVCSVPRDSPRYRLPHSSTTIC